MSEELNTVEELPQEASLPEEPKKRGRKKKEEAVSPKTEEAKKKHDRKSRVPHAEGYEAVDRLAKALEDTKDKPYATLEDLEAMPLKTYEDYLNYNKAVRERRKFLRKKDVEYMYAPLEIVPTRKVRITRTSNRGTPISLNFRKLDKAVWFRSPKGGFKDGDEIVVPECLINDINNLAEPKYKQIVYPDGSHETVLDYMDNKYSCQIMMEG